MVWQEFAHNLKLWLWLILGIFVVLLVLQPIAI